MSQLVHSPQNLNRRMRRLNQRESRQIVQDVRNQNSVDFIAPPGGALIDSQPLSLSHENADPQELFPAYSHQQRYSEVEQPNILPPPYIPKKNSISISKIFKFIFIGAAFTSGAYLYKNSYNFSSEQIHNSTIGLNDTNILQGNNIKVINISGPNQSINNLIENSSKVQNLDTNGNMKPIEDPYLEILEDKVQGLLMAGKQDRVKIIEIVKKSYLNANNNVKKKDEVYFSTIGFR